MLTVGDITDFLTGKAPLDTAEDWDNCGLLVGDRERPVTAVYICLDITAQAVEAAAASGAQMLVSHHPVIFHPLSVLTADHPVCRLIRRDMAALCLHTNLDKAVGGVNDCLASLLGLTDVRVAADGMSRIGCLSEAVSADDFAHRTAIALHTAVRIHPGTAPVRTVAVCGGAGADLVLPLLEETDAAVTAELRHHEWIGICPEKTVIDGGHYATEIAVTEALASWLTEIYPGLTVVTAPREEPYLTVDKG